MVLNIKANTKMVKNTVQVSTNGIVVVHMRVNLKIICSMAKVIINGMMVDNL